MKTAICYYSRHHGNTRQVLEAMAREGDVELIDVTTRQTVRLERYDCIGFASGVYFGKFHDGLRDLRLCLSSCCGGVCPAVPAAGKAGVFC